MKDDIVSVIAIRTIKEVKNQITEIPVIALPFAIIGLLLNNIIASLGTFVIVLAFIAYDQYRQYLSEIELDTPTAPEDAEHAEKPLQPEPNVLSEDEVVQVEPTVVDTTKK